MPRKTFWIAASCILAVIGLRPVFSASAPPASSEKVVYSFNNGADGGYPVSDLTLDSAGNLYGTTTAAGSTACNGGCGTVFELKRLQNGWKEEVLYSFIGGADGATPKAGVIFDRSGNLYGTTARGGDTYGDGTVFKLTPSSRGGWTESIIYSFNYYGSPGRNPAADLVFDAEGNLYGTTSQSEIGNCQLGCGAVFKLTPQSDGSWKETTVYDFKGAPDGGSPSSGLVLSSGKFYGMTEIGGTGLCFFAPGCGTFYELTQNSDGSWTETVIYNFVPGGGFGKYPSGEPLLNNATQVSGTSSAGGDGYGTVFELRQTKKSGWQQSETHIFFGEPGDGNGPTGRLVTNPQGDQFGVTSGRYAGHGTVFQLAHSQAGWREKILHVFAGPPDGGGPAAGLASDSQGHLYGTTQYGGSGPCDGGCGTVYEVVP